MAEIDDRAFNNMRRATDRPSDRLFEKGRMFTESEYNTKASNLERGEYDSQAYSVLRDLYSEDRERDRFQTLNFSQFLQNLDNEYLEEKFLYPRKDDPKYYREAGELLMNVYGGDPEQLKLSAYNAYDKEEERERSNVSIKAPEAEKY